MIFIKNFPVAFLKEEKCLVLSELHLGIEHEFFQSGIVIPSQAKKFAKIINKLIKKTKAEKLIIVGDVKHKIPGISLRERYEIPKFFSLLNDIDIIIVKGNHDAGLEKILHEIKIFGSKGFRINKFGFFHGHAWPDKRLMSCEYLFASHLHPCVEMGKVKFNIQRVWIKTKVNVEKIKRKYRIKDKKPNLIILPAFNNLVGCLAINKKFDKISGVLKNFIDKKNSQFFLIDGTYLGNLFL